MSEWYRIHHPDLVDVQGRLYLCKGVADLLIEDGLLDRIQGHHKD
jgi:hypothetical protein